MDLAAPVSVHIEQLQLVGVEPRHQGAWVGAFQAELARSLDGATVRPDVEFGPIDIPYGSPEAMGRAAAREIARRLRE